MRDLEIHQITTISKCSVVGTLVHFTAHEAQVYLPAALRNVLKANQREIIENDTVARAPDDPSSIRIILKWFQVHFVNETLYRACDVLRHFGARNGTRWILEVARRDLTRPRRVAPNPLETGQLEFLDELEDIHAR